MDRWDGLAAIGLALMVAAIYGFWGTYAALLFLGLLFVGGAVAGSLKGKR